jgi:hypothetical protein
LENQRELREGVLLGRRQSFSPLQFAWFAGSIKRTIKPLLWFEKKRFED